MKSSRIFFFLLFIGVGNLRANASVLIMNGLTHLHNGAGGNSLTGSIKMKNDGKKDARVLIYGKDLVLSCENSSSSYPEINSHNRSLGKWLKTNVDERILQPNEEYEVTYSIDIPTSVVENGTYWELIMVEVADPIRDETPQGVKVDSKVRYGIQVITNVGVYKTPALSFSKVELNELPKNPKDTINLTKPKVIKVRLHNEGIFLAQAKLNIEIFNSVGDKVKILNGIQRKIYPNFCSDFEIELIDLPKGKYEGVLVADNGKDLYGENLTIEID
jgi:hypothetical protein